MHWQPSSQTVFWPEAYLKTLGPEISWTWRKQGNLQVINYTKKPRISTRSSDEPALERQACMSKPSQHEVLVPGFQSLWVKVWTPPCFFCSCTVVCVGLGCGPGRLQLQLSSPCQTSTVLVTCPVSLWLGVKGKVPPCSRATVARNVAYWSGYLACLTVFDLLWSKPYLLSGLSVWLLYSRSPQKYGVHSYMLTSLHCYMPTSLCSK